MAWQRAAVAIERSLVPIISTLAADPLGFGRAGVKDGCLAATHGASFATPHGPSAQVPLTQKSATLGTLQEAHSLCL